MGIFAAFLQTKLWKKVLERAVLKLSFQDGAPIQRAILGGALRVKGAPGQGAPSARVPAGLPTLKLHSFYVTC